MFDLITGTGERPLRERSFTSKLVAIATHVVVIVVVIAIPLLRVTNQLPELPTMRAFVVEPSAPSPPPPPPPPPPAGPRAAVKSVPTTGQFAAPVEAPGAIEPERLSARDESIAGALGGVEGGVPGGVTGGVVGGILSSTPPPPPPPPPPAPVTARAPVRIGGQITAPALLHRVEPKYPDVAAIAQLSGMVILEAVVNTEGCVESVKILRSRHLLLDKASEEALRQWRYSPLVLNGIPASFVLTVTFNFSVQR
jgi:periplasmic protein TonB